MQRQNHPNFDPVSHTYFRFNPNTLDYEACPIRFLDADFLAWPRVIFPADWQKFKNEVAAAMRNLKQVYNFSYEFKPGAVNGNGDQFNSEDSYILLKNNETGAITNLPCGQVAMAINQAAASSLKPEEIIKTALSQINVT